MRAALKHLGVSYLLVGLAFLVLVLRLGHPHHRLIALILYGISWIPFIFSFPRRRALVRYHRMRWGGRLKTYLPHIILACILAAFIYVARVLVPVVDSPLISISPAELERNLEDDADAARYLNVVMLEMVNKANESGLMGKSVVELTPEEKNEIRSLWRDFLQTGLELDFLQKEYKGFYQIDFVARSKEHAYAFLNAYYAFVCIYRTSLEMLLPLKANESMSTMLNEQNLAYALPANSLFDLQQHLVHQDTLLRLNAGRAYLQFLKKELVDRQSMVDELEANLLVIDKRGWKNIDKFINPLEVLEYHAFQAWFPVQKQIAVQMSFMRTTDREYFIQPAQLEVMRDQLQPGDILIERRNWHITNLGIPGFWPHLALYTGNLKEMSAFFAEVQTGGVSFEEALKTLHPEVYATYAKADSQRVIEAKRDGVIVQSLEESGNCDYLAVLRPRVSRADTMNAVLNSFKFHGRPYDYNFDFATDTALVCSELICKAYEGSEGFRIEPVVQNGRLLFPPNDLIRIFDEQFESDNPEMDFVYFLDGSEAAGVARVRDAEALRGTWRRVKWDVMQE